MARILLPEELVTVEYQAVKRPRAALAFNRRTVAICVAAFTLTLLITLPTLICYWWKSDTIVSTLPTGPLSNDYVESSIDESGAKGETSTTTPSSTAATAAYSENQRPPTPLSNAGGFGHFSSSMDRSHEAVTTHSATTRRLPLDEWVAFLNMSTPATETPLSLVPGSVSLMDETRPLYLEVHPEHGYCLAVMSLTDSVKRSNGSNGKQTVIQRFAKENFAEFYRRLHRNFSAPWDMYKLGLDYVYQHCKDLPVIPVRQMKGLPKGRYFVVPEYILQDYSEEDGEAVYTVLPIRAKR